MGRNKIALSSLALDLKRIALGYYRGSDAMAKRFLEEVVKREKEIDRSSVKPYIRTILDKIESIGQRKDRIDIAEDALMYSTLLQNACLEVSGEVQ